MTPHGEKEASADEKQTNVPKDGDVSVRVVKKRAGKIQKP